MSFSHIDKGPGDLIRSMDWNEMGREIQRLGADKVDRAGDDTVAGPLSVQGALTVGATNRGAALRVYNRQEDGYSAEHGTLVLGTDSAASASLRLGYAGPYSWIQGRGRSTLAINPGGGNVGIGTDAPRDRLEVAGALRVGSGANPLQIGGGGHTGFVNDALENAEISNDTDQHKTLMILGNRSAGLGRRVSVWDRLEVNGALAVTGDAAVGGSATVNGELRVADAIVPLAGNAETAGVRFRRDGGGGAGMRYYDRGSQAFTLELGITGGTDDHVALMPSGNVGIGVAVPRERLEVAGALRVGSGANPLQVGGGGHTGFVNDALENAEITNDTDRYKTLMILGNRSAGLGRRVSVWDRLEVNGALAVTGDTTLGGAVAVAGRLSAGNLTVTGTNPLRITSGAPSGFADESDRNAEICNDPDRSKSLLLIGNKSAGYRRVSVWDLLEVNGHLNVQKSASAVYMRVNGQWVPGSREDRIEFLRGCVNSEGTIQSGVGFSVSRPQAGLYEITFNTAFAGRPAGVVTQVYPDFDNFGAGGDTRDNAVITGISATRMRVVTGGSSGIAGDRDFCFIVMGPV